MPIQRTKYKLKTTINHIQWRRDRRLDFQAPGLGAVILTEDTSITLTDQEPDYESGVCMGQMTGQN